jgi:hypothetical protein
LFRTESHAHADAEWIKSEIDRTDMRGSAQMPYQMVFAAAFAASLIPAFLVAAPAAAQQANATIIALDSLKWNPIAFPGLQEVGTAPTGTKIWPKAAAQ